MVERTKLNTALSHCTLEEFLSERLKRYIKDITALERANLYDSVISEVEKALIKIVMDVTEGNQVKAAKALGISRSTLREKLRLYKIGDTSGMVKVKVQARKVKKKR